MIDEAKLSQKTIFSFEIFPPKKTMPIDTIFSTLDELKGLNPDFISVTFGAGGSENCDNAVAIAKRVKDVCNVESVIHMPCLNMTKKDAEFATKFVLYELNEVLKDVDTSKLIVAYEPIWSIGTGDLPDAEYIEKVTSAIKRFAGINVTLYGGSFNESNFEEIAGIESVDGALVGGASLKPEVVVKIQKRLKEIL